MINIKNVTKSYGQDDNKITVLNDISFSIYEGRFVSILGTSGSGKTTLMKCISGIEEIDSGEIVYDDINIGMLSKEERKRFRLDSSINKLSGGQRQRVAIARALITKPKLICADEPTGNLDCENTAAVISLFQKINKDMNTTILMITHDHSISEYSDTIINIEDGRLEQWK